MKKYKTKATKAEEQILELLKDNKNIHLPWGLVKKTLVNRTLDCTADEVRIIFENNANVRPGFEVNDDTVFSPNLLVKFSGIDDNTRYFQRISDLKSLINTFAYENFNGFCDNPMDEMNLKVYFNDDGSLNSSKLLHSDCFQFSYLRREYQILLLKKFEEIINHKNEYFMSSTAALPDTE